MNAKEAFKNIYDLIIKDCEKIRMIELLFDEMDILNSEFENAVSAAENADEIERLKLEYESKKELIFERYPQEECQSEFETPDDTLMPIFDILCMECANADFCGDIVKGLRAKAELLEGRANKEVLRVASSIEIFSKYRANSLSLLTLNALRIFKNDKVVAKYDIYANTINHHNKHEGIKKQTNEIMTEVLKHKNEIEKTGVFLVWYGLEYSLFNDLKNELNVKMDLI